MESRSLLEIQDKIKDIIISVADFEVTKEMIEDGKDGIKKLGLNSLGLIRMIVEIEVALGVEIDLEDTDPEVLSSITELAVFVKARLDNV